MYTVRGATKELNGLTSGFAEGLSDIDLSDHTTQGFGNLEGDKVNKIKIDVWILEKILSQSNVFISIEKYVNGRPTKSNLNLIKTGIGLLLRGYLDFKQIHSLILAFELKCLEMNTDNILPLNSKILNETLRS